MVMSKRQLSPSKEPTLTGLDLNLFFTWNRGDIIMYIHSKARWILESPAAPGLLPIGHTGVAYVLQVFTRT
jgi:hypothetical protein